METYIESIRKQFLYYKKLGEQAMGQVNEADLFWQPDEESNSIAVIVRHLSGNMLSRFTDFLTSDGEKPWRNRDAEFENGFQSRAQVMDSWEKGWQCLLKALEDLQQEDLEKIVYIRNEGHSVTEALNRQLAHYPYHVGQLVFIAKMRKGKHWQTLSIARNRSSEYNEQKFSVEKGKRHFTDNT